MKRYADWKPTQFDAPGLAIDDEREAWLVAPCMLTRDSGTLDHSNWAVQSESFDAEDPDGTDHETHRFGHWACGWFETTIVRPESKCARLAADFEASLGDYPVLDESHLCELESLKVVEDWGFMSLAERIEVCQHVGVSIFAARRESVCDRVYNYLRERVT